LHRVIQKAAILVSMLMLTVCLLAETSYQMHTVKKGDTLFGLARQYGVTVNDIKQLNDLRDSRLDIGQKLKIKPETPAPQPVKKQEQAVQPVLTETSGDWQVYEVVKGDNLYNIGKRFNVSVDDLKKNNELPDIRLKIGQKLKIKLLAAAPPPVKKTETTPPPATETLPKKIVGAVSTVQEKPKPATTDTSAVAVPAAVTPDELPEEYFHTVQPKENLYRIAKNAGIDLKDLLRFNNFETDNIIIQPNQKIIIKDPASYHVATTTPSPTETEQRTSDLAFTAPPQPDSVLIEKIYIVQRKDNLYRIALENNMTVEELKKLNNLKSNNIYVGQKLYITPPKDRPPGSRVAEVITEEDLKTKAKIREDLIMPIDGKLLSEYGIRNGRPHKGIDIGAPAGSPIYAVLDGTVVYAGIQGNYGNVVVLEHPDFVMTVYAHNEKNLVSVGDVVKQGHLIATIGSTGNATTPHVHFEYRIKGKAINPRKVLPLGA